MLFSNKKKHVRLAYLIFDMSWRWYEGTPLTKVTQSFQVGSRFYPVIRVNTSRFKYSSHVCPYKCSAHGVGTDSMAEVHSLIPYAVGP